MTAPRSRAGLQPLGRSELAVGAGILCILAALIIPLPHVLLDTLFAFNLALGVMLLAAVLYVPEVLAVSTLPSVLLLAALYRVALEVAATRLILSGANPGGVIRAYGRFVVQGNYVVGAVVFAIITLVQYVVIARGGERLAEVGARFALDAMPGKQLAIDADVRSGALDRHEAAAQRYLVVRESGFFGAMDGAMKFVKGDAIAGIVIALLNVTAGMAVGIAQQGMSADTALRTFGLLAIGQGLAAQVPALLISTAAGIVVTRVASDDPEGTLGRDIASQWFAHPGALLVAVALMLLAATLPGMPPAPFLTVAAMLGLGAWIAQRRSVARRAALVAATDVPTIAPLVVALAMDDTRVQSAVRDAREAVIAQSGVALPVVAFERAATPGTLEVRVRGVTVARLPGPLGEPVAVRDALTSALWSNAGLFMGVQEAQRMLDALERTHPALVRTVVPQRVGLSALAEVLRSLLAERVSVRDLVTVLEALADASLAGATTAVLVRRARVALRRQINHDVAPNGKLRAHYASPELSDLLREPPGNDPRKLDERRAAARVAVKPGDVLMAPYDVRARVREVFARVLPDTPVLALDEVLPDIAIEQVGWL